MYCCITHLIANECLFRSLSASFPRFLTSGLHRALQMINAIDGKMLIADANKAGMANKPGEAIDLQS